MPVYFDQRNKRWRFEFDRKIGERRYRTTKLLPKSWGSKEADEFAREEEAKLYALATGQVKQEYSISAAVKLYLEEKAAGLKSSDDYEREFENLYPLYKGLSVDQLPKELTPRSSVPASSRLSTTSLWFHGSLIRRPLGCTLKLVQKYIIRLGFGFFILLDLQHLLRWSQFVI